MAERNGIEPPPDYREVSDADLRHLQHLRSVSQLIFVDCTNITVDGLNHLVGVRGLEFIEIVGPTNLSLAEIRNFQSRLPNCEIQFDAALVSQ